MCHSSPSLVYDCSRQLDRSCMLARLLGPAALFLFTAANPLFSSSNMLCHASAGPARGGAHAAAAMDGTRQHTTRPIVTGTSVLGIKYK